MQCSVSSHASRFMSTSEGFVGRSSRTWCENSVSLQPFLSCSRCPSRSPPPEAEADCCCWSHYIQDLQCCLLLLVNIHVEMLLLLSYTYMYTCIDNLVKWNQTRLSKYFKNKTNEKPRKLGKYCGNMTVGTVFIFILYYHIVSIVFYFLGWFFGTFLRCNMRTY